MAKQLTALNELRQLARKMRAAGLNSIALQGKNWSVRMAYAFGMAPAQQATAALISLPAAPAHTAICAPMPGNILLEHPLNGVTYARPGQQIKQDDLLALVQVGALYLPVSSPADGTLLAIAVVHNQRVEYGSEVALLSAVTPG